MWLDDAEIVSLDSRFPVLLTQMDGTGIEPPALHCTRLKWPTVIYERLFHDPEMKNTVIHSRPAWKVSTTRVAHPTLCCNNCGH